MSKITDLSRTIVALATALGSGSIAVIRVSGKNAFDIVNSVFVGRDITREPGNTVHLGKIIYQEHKIDQVLLTLFRAPASYTGENIVEISCHANPFIVDKIIDILIQSGAQHAGPGEFTLRAFLNHKLDLAQAEAVADIIRTKSKIGIENSLQQLEGSVTGRINKLKNELIYLISHIEIDLDFNEENIIIASAAEINMKLGDIVQAIDHLIKSYNYGRIFNSTLKMALIGPTNAGKSTLMNQLLGEDRAITSHIPGTTRDTLHENIIIDNVFFSLIDTAGLRATKDDIETIGISRTKEQIKNADIILYLIDINTDHKTNDLVEMSIDRDKIIIVANKTDLGLRQEVIKKWLKLKLPTVYISAKTGAGISDLKRNIINLVAHGFEKYDDQIIITSKRHRDCLRNTRQFIVNAQKTIDANLGNEFVSVELREALHTLGQITGETANDDILNQIFKNFCIGK